MILGAVQAFQSQPVQQTHNVEENLEPISPALRTIAGQYDARGPAPGLNGRVGYPEDMSYEKCDKLYRKNI